MEAEYVKQLDFETVFGKERLHHKMELRMEELNHKRNLTVKEENLKNMMRMKKLNMRMESLGGQINFQAKESMKKWVKSENGKLSKRCPHCDTRIEVSFKLSFLVIVLQFRINETIV